MNAETKVPAPRANEERAEQSPSRDSVVFNVPLTPQQREHAQRRARLRRDAQARLASWELDTIAADWDARGSHGRFVPSERWTRNLGNQLVREGFDAEYVAHLLGLPVPRRAVAA